MGFLMSHLTGKQIALLEGRMHSELADLVRRHGGTPRSVPALREVARDSQAEVATFLTRLQSGALQVVVCLTGVGVAALCREAEALGRLPALVEALRQVTVVCRGPKPLAVLRRHAIPVHLQAQEPYTTPDLLDAMAGLDLAGQGVALLHYGERNAALSEALQARGAQLEELCLYEWRLPEDLTLLQQLVKDLVAGQLDAIAFTTQVHARHLWQIATDMGLASQLTQALTQHCVVAAVGPTCAAALTAFGVTAQVVPSNPKMGPMVLALEAYFAQTLPVAHA